MMTYIHHGACLLIDAIDPIGTMDRRVYQRIGEVYRQTERYEKWLGWGKQVFDVALYYDLNGKFDINQPPAIAAGGAELNGSMPMQEALLGAARSLREHHIPYGVVNNWKLERMREGKVIALCDVPDMGETQQDQVLAFVREGGSVYMSGGSAPTILREVFGLTYDGYTSEAVTYISPTPEGQHLMEGHYTPDYPLVMFEKQVKVKGIPKGDVLGKLTLPYTVPNVASNIADPFFAQNDADKQLSVKRFASIHSNPPGKYTDSPALVRAQYGKGQVIWCALPIEKANRQQHSDIFARLMAELCGNEFAFGATAPDFVECVLFDAPEHSAKLMGVITVQDNFRALPAYDFEIRIRTGVKPRRVYMLPDERPIDFSYADGLVAVAFDKMELYAMFALEV